MFAVAMLICGFLYWNLIVSKGPGAGITIFAIILCATVTVYLRVSGKKLTKKSILCLAIVGVSVLNFLLYDLTLISFFNFIFLSVAVVYWICLCTERSIAGKLSIYSIGNLVNQLLVVPFSNFICLFASFRRPMKGNKYGKGVLSGVIGIIIFLPILALVVNLLMNADAAFEGLLRNIKFSLSEDMIEYVIQIIFGIPVACYLYGLVYGNLKGRHTDKVSIESIDKGAAAFRFAPRIPVFSALTVLNGIYLLFFISQTAYLFSAFGNNIPETMTYAEYARRGFFELCGVAFINLLVIGVAHLITNRSNERKTQELVGNSKPANSKAANQKPSLEKVPKVLKIETVFLCGFTLLLILTALRKMIMYIDYYGLTQLRVYTTWFMLVLFIFFIIIGVRQFKEFNGSRIAIIAFIISFLALTYGNVDGNIAKYNIERYKEGTLLSVDVEMLKELSDAAIPHMVELYGETEDPVLMGRLESAITGEYEWGMEVELPSERNFRNFNLQQYKADQLKLNFLYRE